MQAPCKTRRTLLAAPLLALLPAAASAGSATLRVQATVLRHANVSVVRCDRTLHITEEDIRRGWVRCRESMVLRVRANHAEGVAVDLVSNGGEFTSVSVLGPQVSMTEGATGGRMHVATVPGERQVALDFRFAVAPDARPGVHPWPVVLSVAA